MPKERRTLLNCVVSTDRHINVGCDLSSMSLQVLHIVKYKLAGRASEHQSTLCFRKTMTRFPRL